MCKPTPSLAVSCHVIIERWLVNENWKVTKWGNCMKSLALVQQLRFSNQLSTAVSVADLLFLLLLCKSFTGKQFEEEFLQSFIGSHFINPLWPEWCSDEMVCKKKKREKKTI